MRFLFGVVAIILLSGCTTVKYRVWLETVQYRSALLSGVRNVYLVPWYVDDEQPAKIREYKAYIARAYELAGFRVTNRLRNADIVVVFMTERQRGRQLATIPARVSATVFKNKSKAHMPYTRGLILTGYRTADYVLNTRNRRFRNPARVRGKNELWRTTIASAGSSGSMSEIVPVMMAAAIPHLGRESDGIHKIILVPGDVVINRVKGYQGPDISGRRTVEGKEFRPE